MKTKRIKLTRRQRQTIAMACTFQEECELRFNYGLDWSKLCRFALLLEALAGEVKGKQK